MFDEVLTEVGVATDVSTADGPEVPMANNVRDLHPLNHVRETVNWRSVAACRGMQVALFYPESSDDAGYEAARQICESCSVRTDCLAEAVGNREVDGMWGGATPKERRRLRRRLSRKSAA